jgi:hypothetical protein
MNRREFVGALAMGVLPAIQGLAADVDQNTAAPGTPAAGQAKRRIIWNNDGDDLRMVAFGVRRLWNVRDNDNAPLSVPWSGANAEGRSRWRINGNETRLLSRGERGALVYDGAGLKAGLNRLRVTVTSGSPAEAAGLVLETVRVTVARI